MTRPEEAEQAFRNGTNCSQAILVTYGPAFGLDEATALRLGAGMGAGIGWTGRVCGAANGACLVLGLKHGPTERSASREEALQAATEFLDRFEKRVGSVDCLSLMGCSLRMPAERARAREQGLYQTKCTRYVREAAEILEEML
jgi:C_GCAxxG_C_C family probable redox protein